MGTLSIIGTPIGNLEDITLRALRVLSECDVIYAEDTRVVSKLLARHQIKKPLMRLDAITEKRKSSEVLKRLKGGEWIAYVSDAGTPGISDPGGRLVAFIREKSADIRIEAIPGPSALTAALSIAGLDSPEFTFLGFLPHKKGRQTLLKKIAESKLPIVLYESPHRVLKLMSELEALSVKKVTVLRELTKVHEEVQTGTPTEAKTHYAAHPDTVRGEFVVIIEP